MRSSFRRALSIGNIETPKGDGNVGAHSILDNSKRIGNIETPKGDGNDM